MALALDTLALARELRDGGFEERQAETLAVALGKAAGAADVATRTDLEDLRADLRAEIEMVRSDLRSTEKRLMTEIDHSAALLRAEMKQFVTELHGEIQRQTIRLGVMLVTVAGLTLAAAKALWP